MNDSLSTSLERRLEALADGYDSPLVAIADDLNRGRRRERRRRRSIGIGVAAAAALLVAAPLMASAWVDGSAPPSATANRPTGPSLGLADEVDLPLAPSDPDSGPPGVSLESLMDQDVAIAMRSAIAGHLDSSGTHISEASIADTRSISIGSDDGETLTELWLSFDWSVPGEPGRDMVNVRVSSTPLVDCEGSDVVCHDTVLDGLAVVRAEAGPGAGTEEMTWSREREDGYFVSVATSNDVDISDAQLAAALSDPVLDLPGHPSPPEFDLLPATYVRNVARDFLGDRLGVHEFWTAETAPYWAGGLRAPLIGSVDVMQELQAYDFQEACDEASRIRCTLGTIDGHPIRVEQFNKVDDADGNTKVMYAGPTRQITVWVNAQDHPGSSLPVKEAIRLATDPRLQS